MTEFRFPTLKIPKPGENTGSATKHAVEPNGRAPCDCVPSSREVWAPELRNMASPVSGERIRLNADIGGARLSASPDAINFLDTIPRVGALPLARPGVFGGVSCAPIHLNAAEVATPRLLLALNFRVPQGPRAFHFFQSAAPIRSLNWHTLGLIECSIGASLR